MEIQLLKVAKFCRRLYGGEGGGGGGLRTHLTPPTKRLWISATSRSYIFARLRRITFKFGNITNLRRSSQWCRPIFPNWSIWKVEKPWKGLLRLISEYSALAFTPWKEFQYWYLLGKRHTDHSPGFNSWLVKWKMVRDGPNRTLCVLVMPQS